MTHDCVYNCEKHNFALNMHVCIDQQWVGKATLAHDFLRCEHQIGTCLEHLVHACGMWFYKTTCMHKMFKACGNLVLTFQKAVEPPAYTRCSRHVPIQCFLFRKPWNHLHAQDVQGMCQSSAYSIERYGQVLPYQSIADQQKCACSVKICACEVSIVYSTTKLGQLTCETKQNELVKLTLEQPSSY